ncbi:DUF2220 family protein [Puniceicoccaceae bacterium K14]|nr:DUF2220 family protein [Puniceicoccaceae bacterium K14]
MNIQRIPVAKALFRQWVKARGNKGKKASRDFIRSWNQIEEDSFYAGGIESEVIRDLKDLAAEGWLKVVPEKYYSHRVAKIRLPLEMEDRWKEAFDFAEPNDSNIKQIADHNWHSKLAFLKTIRVSIPFSNLVRMDQYLRFKREDTIQLSIKERSIRIFGDEKRLDEMYRGSQLFQKEYLSLDDFDCYLVAEPLAWIRGRFSDGPVVVLENAATFETYHQWDKTEVRYSAIVYGGGNRFYDSARRMREIYQELGGERETIYFGDIDAAGIRIARMASEVFIEMGLPPLAPDFGSYSKLIAIALNKPDLRKWEGLNSPSEKDLSWLGELGPQVEELIFKYGRIAQEWLNIEQLLNAGEDIQDKGQV